jgi:ankyrin repeat protein
MPKMLGYPWEGDILSSHVHIEDVLGRPLVLPIMLCRTSETLKDTMRIMFSDHPGMKEVVEGNFELVDKRNQLTIFDGRDGTPQTRDYYYYYYYSPHVVQPGAKLLMNILRVKTIHAPRHSLVASVQALETCPRCGFATPGRRFRKWQVYTLDCRTLADSHSAQCDMEFRKSVRELSKTSSRSAGYEYWPKVPLPRTIPNAAPPLDYAPTTLPNADLEIGYIRRIHEIAEYLVPSNDFSKDFGTSRLPLIQAVGQGDLHWVRQILLTTDTDPDTRDCQNWTALQQACSIEIDSPESRSQEAIVRLLISQGAHVNAAGDENFGRTALQAACYSGNEKIVDILLEKGADINADVCAFDGQSSLACAVEAGHFGIVKKLLNLGADVNQPGGELDGNTALSAAAKQGNLEILDSLIENGANTESSAGWLAMRAAISCDKLDVARRLLEKGLDVNSCCNGPAPLHSVGSIDMLNLLVTYGARFDLPGSEAYGPTALQWAAQFGSLNLVTELVRLGSDVHHPGAARGGRSALQAAAASRCKYDPEESVHIMSFLVEEHRADVNEPPSGKDGYTSLEAACHATVMRDEDERGIDSVKFLVGKGAIITPFTLHVAAAWNHTELLDFLLQNGARLEDIISPTNVPIVDGWPFGFRELGSTVIETAKINGHLALAEALKNWSPSTQLEMYAGEGDLDREDTEREYPDWEEFDRLSRSAA